MSITIRPGVALTYFLSLCIVGNVSDAFAQRGGAANSPSNRERADDDDEDENSDHELNDRKARSRTRTNTLTREQFNELLKRAPSGQHVQRDSNAQSRKNRQRDRDDDRARQADDPFGPFPRDGRSGELQSSSPFESQRSFRPKQGSQDLRIGGWQGNRWQGSRHVDNWSRVFAGGKRPFSADWYKEHPKAWKYENNKANVWVSASLPGVYRWLGWGDVPPQYNVHIGPTRHFDHSHYGRWYPLGVYSLMSGAGDMGTRVVQLAIDQHGHIAGNYYDLITDTNSSISGDVRRQSQRVHWHLNKNDFVHFEAPLYRLLQPYGQITVDLPGGQQDWRFVRLEN